MSIDFYDPKLWDAIAAHLYKPYGGYHCRGLGGAAASAYDTANIDHCTDIAEIVCEALAAIERDRDNAWLEGK